MFRKIFLSVFLLIYSFFPLISSAQKASVVRDNLVPLEMKINNFSYSNEKRIVSIDFSVTNSSNSFVDNLKYSFEFYKGDKLEEKGLLFRNLDYIVSTNDEFGRLYPGETKRQTIQYTPPETIEGGNYFIRAAVFNEELSVYGITYTKEPIRLTGRGGFISNVVGALVDDGKIYGLMEGPTLEKDKTYKIAFPKTANEELFNYLNEEDVLVDIKVSHINDPDNFVNEKRNVSLREFLREDEKGIEIPFEPWLNMQSGSYTAFVSFKNSKGEQLSESILVRLLYRGLLGRIYESQTNINSYKRGQPIDLVVNVVLAGDPDAKLANLKAVFKNSKGDSQEFNQEVVLNKTFQGVDVDVNFNNEKSKKMLVEEIELTLTDEVGNILDTHTITLDTSKIFEYPRDFSWVKNVLLSILILVLIIVGLAFVKKKFNLNILASIIAILLIGGSFLIDLDKNYFVFAQTGDSNDSGVCTDPFASNYNQPLPCNYDPQGYCNDPAALNYGELAECIYDNGQYGCIDVNATNYNPNATIDDGSCEYENDVCGNFSLGTTPGSLQIQSGTSQGITFNGVGADPQNNTWNVNFFPGIAGLNIDLNNHIFTSDQSVPMIATVDSGINFNGQDLIYTTIGYNAWCDDSQGGANFDGTVDVQITKGNPGTPRLIGDLLDIWSNPDGTPNGLQGICEDDCIDTEYYVKLQCKQCGNQALDLDINYYNNWTGNNQAPNGKNDLTYTVDTVSDEYLFDFSYYTVSEDKLLEKQSENLALNNPKIKPAPDARLAGIPTAANDVINQWIYGPFNFPFCFEYKDENGNLVEQNIEDGIYSQSSNVQAETQFGGDYCQLSFEEGSVEKTTIEQEGSFNGVSNEIRDLLCELPGNIQGTFFLDTNEDGVRTSDEPYIKSSNANSNCSGEIGNVLGRIVSANGIFDFTSLASANCTEELRPYFEKDELLPGTYIPGLDPGSASGWIQTGLQYLNGSIWETVESILLNVNQTAKVNIGIKNAYDVVISCGTTPQYSINFPLDVEWAIDAYYSDEYDISDLTFTWSGETGTNKNLNISGGNNEGSLFTTYNQSTGGEKIYTVSVVAKNNLGQIVSNSTECSVGAGVSENNLEVACYAYTSLSDATPNLFFGVGEQVYWKSIIDGGIEPFTYEWTGDASGSNSNSGPYDVVQNKVNPWEYSYGDGPIYTANLSVTDFEGANSEAVCSISVKQCITTLDCAELGFPQNYICDSQTFTCVLPPPVFITPLSLDPGIVNEGEKCGLTWKVESADSCIVYKNGEVYEANAEIEDTLDVDPGTYTIRCENADTEEFITAGPVRCLVNPEIREQ